MINSDIEYLSFEENYFDVITMWDVIEHIKNPTTILKKIYKLLNFDGLLCIETPNNDSIYHLILKKEWISFREISHIYFYSPETLTRILNKVGFKAVKIETENVNFFSMEGLRRFSMNTYAYDLKLVLNKLSEILINNNCVKYKKEKDRSVNFFTEFRNKFTELANYPTNLLFNYLLMGDQLRIFCKKM
jgi:2-polyprenyl-3-methyl-5-hydroxy-6-metoxy-1,4-benzoquinol methylase